MTISKLSCEMLANLQFFSYRAVREVFPLTQLDITARFIPELISGSIISKKSQSFCMTTFSASHKNRTVLLPQWCDCSCYVSRPILAPQPFWLQKHTELCTHDFVHSSDLWHPSRLVKFTCASRWRFCGIHPAVTSDCVAFILAVKLIGAKILKGKWKSRFLDESGVCPIFFKTEFSNICTFLGELRITSSHNLFSVRCVLEIWCGWFWVVLVLQAEASPGNTQRTENKTTDVVNQQHSRKLLMMDILMSETCWAHNKGNKIASDIKLVFHSSTSEL